jgi:hypothetical protein
VCFGYRETKIHGSVLSDFGPWGTVKYERELQRLDTTKCGPLPRERANVYRHEEKSKDVPGS